MSSAHRLVHVATRLLSAPLAIHEDKGVVILSALRERLGIARLDTLMGETLDEDAMDVVAANARLKPRGAATRGYEVIDDIAVLTIEGTLVNRLGSLRPYSGMTGYDGISTNLTQASADKDVRGIFLDIDSPGGEVAGWLEVVDEVHALSQRSGGKPIVAYANDDAYSAAYGLAAAADKFFLPRTGGAGSVGVLAIHVNEAARLHNAGLAVEIMRAGAQKAEFNSIERMTPAARSRVQSEIDRMRMAFAEVVARGRGIAVDDVLATEARTLMGEDAVAAGFADGVSSQRDAWNHLKRMTR